MKTKQTLMNTGSLLMIGFACTAQPMGPHHDKRGQIEAHKIAFITGALDLTPEEAQVFWPVYNQCQKEREEFRKSNRKQFKEGGEHNPLDEMSDKEVEILVDNEIAMRQKELDMDKECHAKYKQVLPIKKIAKLYRAEMEFKKVLLKKMQEHKKAPRTPEPPEGDRE